MTGEIAQIALAMWREKLRGNRSRLTQWKKKEQTKVDSATMAQHQAIMFCF